MPEFPIIDAHVHLYDPAAIAFPWMADVPLLDRRHGLDEFTAASAGVAIDGLVFVEVDAADGRHLDEARWVEQHGGHDPRLAGMVASMPLEKGASVEADLETFAALPRARGVRRLIQDRPSGWTLQAPFVEGVRRLARFGLSFDLCIRHPQLSEILDLVRRCPEVHFVLDHIGKPDIRAGVAQPWRRQIGELAREPNVWCKISGVVTEADHAAWTVTDIAPFVRHAIESFGFDRCMFGGDWPVSKLATDYHRWVDTLDGLVDTATEAERRSLYREVATRFYRLGR